MKKTTKFPRVDVIARQIGARQQAMVTGGKPPEHANNENGRGNPHNLPIIQPLYGVIIAE